MVFERNAEPVWARANRTLSNSLSSILARPPLEGGTRPEEAYFVKVDLTKNDPN